jgi:transcriptional regulator with XRE-family HTH domain
MESLNVRAGKLVAEHRKRHDISQLQLANYLELTRTSISNIERGKQAMSLGMFCKIANYLQVAPDMLLKQVLDSKHDTLTLVSEDEVSKYITEFMSSTFTIKFNSRSDDEPKKD